MNLRIPIGVTARNEARNILTVLGRNLARRPQHFWRRYFEAAYIRNYRGTTTAARIIRNWAAVPSFPREYRLRKAFTVEIRPAGLARALTAIRAYQTQVPDLFDGESDRKSLYGAVPETMYRVSLLPHGRG
jgi:hypothetical protein